MHNVHKLRTPRASHQNANYSNSGNVEGLFDALHYRYLDSIFESKILEALNESTNQPDLRRVLHHGCKILLEFGYEKLKLIAYFITHPMDDALLVRQVAVESMFNNLKFHRSEVTHQDLRKASENSTRLIYYPLLGLVFLEPSEFIGRKKPFKCDRINRRYGLRISHHGVAVQKICDSRSKRFLKHQPLPHQNRFLALRNTFTKAGIVRYVVRNSPPHLHHN